MRFSKYLILFKYSYFGDISFLPELFRKIAPLDLICLSLPNLNDVEDGALLLSCNLNYKYMC